MYLHFDSRYMFYMILCFIKGRKPIMDMMFPIKSKHMYGRNIYIFIYTYLKLMLGVKAWNFIALKCICIVHAFMKLYIQ